jgi:quinol monooxygenase YgiN
MIHVVAVITTKPGQRASVLTAFQENAPAVRAESGCIEYTATVDISASAKAWATFGPDTFVVVEKWESREALEAHAVSSHMQAYAGRVRDRIVSRAIHVLAPV